MSRANPSPVSLPIDAARVQILAALRKCPNLVLQAEPGSGKTTRLPRVLRDFLGPSKRILVLEPRRVAARSAAQRIASEQGWSVGGAEIGYHVRFDRRCSDATQIVFLTEALLHRYLLNDPQLKNVGAIVFDEFHERAANTDVGLGLMVELQSLERPDLHLIAMSATLETERLSRFLSAEVLRVPGSTHGVDIVYGRDSLRTRTDEVWADRLAQMIHSLFSGALERRGDVLCFLPGHREIRAVDQRLNQLGFPGAVQHLYGQMDLDSQSEVLRPRQPTDRARVILSTNIAESSLTVDGVATVIDSGLERLASIDSIGLTRLHLQRISASSCEQRAGRAGRQRRGLVYRLWSQRDQAAFAEHPSAEILRSDLSEPVLLLAAQGLSNPESFSWYEQPPMTRIREAQSLLISLGQIDGANRITNSGHAAILRGVEPRLCRLLEVGRQAGQSEAAALLASLLSERLTQAPRDSTSVGRSAESDLERSLRMLQPPTIERISRQARILEPSFTAEPKTWITLLQSSDLDQLLLAAYPDRVAARRNPSDPQDLRVLLCSGVGARLSPSSAAAHQTSLLIVLDTIESVESGSEPLITLAHALEASQLVRLKSTDIRMVDSFRFDGERVVGARQEQYRNLPIGPERELPVSAKQRERVLSEQIMSRAEEVCALSPSLKALTSRLEWALANDDAPDGLKSLSPLAADQSLWHAFAEAVVVGRSRWSDVLQLPLAELWLDMASHEAKRSLDQIAPLSMVVPSGRSHPIDYSDPGQGPKLSVRLQELFGWKETPTLGRRRHPLTLEILGPNQRPLQVTRDLARFWSGSYHQIRAELRARYPKHSWPQDPANEPPLSAKPRRSH